MASSFARAQKPLRGRGSKKCPHHGGEVIYACETCGDLACAQCVTNEHKGHNFEGIANTVLDIKQKLQDFIQKAEEDVIPCITENLQALDSDVSKTRQHCSNQISKIRSKNVQLKQELDNLTEKLVKSYQNLEQEKTNPQVKNSNELQAHLDEVNSRIQACKKAIQTDDDVSAFDNSRDISLTFTDVSSPTVNSKLIEFTPAEFSSPQLETIFGKLTISISGDQKQLPTHPPNDVKHQTLVKPPNQQSPIIIYPSKDASRQQAVERTQDQRHQQTHPNHPTDQAATNTQQQMVETKAPWNLGEWSVVSVFDPIDKKTVSSMHAAGENQVWLSSYLHDIILLSDNHGNVQNVLMESFLKHFCLNPTTSNIWYISYLGSVREIVNGRSSLRFDPGKSPLCICVTKDSHVVLGHERHLAKYSSSGQLVSKTSPGGWFYSPLLKTPTRVTECPVTENLAVIDKDTTDCGGKDKPYISILDKDLQPLYTYHGIRVRTKNQPPPNLFQPSDLCYTTDGLLLLTERMSRTLLLVSGKGEYMRTLFTDKMSSPAAVCVQNDHKVLVSFDDHSVKVFQRS